MRPPPGPTRGESSSTWPLYVCVWGLCVCVCMCVPPRAPAPACPPPGPEPCTCYTRDGGVYLDCHDATLKEVKNALKNLPDVQSLSVYDLRGEGEGEGEAQSVELGPQLVAGGQCVRRINVYRGSISIVADEALMPLRRCLEALVLVGVQLRHVPQRALQGQLRLGVVDLSANRLEELPAYAFYGLPLATLTLRGNAIRAVADAAFSSLDHTLLEVDLSENDLTVFPMLSLSRLGRLRSLRLAWNELAALPADPVVLPALEHLDLDSNNFEFISEDCLRFCPSLEKLSLHFNFIANIHYRAFHSLTKLQSLDLSHNRIKILNPILFENNKRLQHVNLMHNHLHHIHGLLSELPSLKVALLSHNNILDVPIDSFHNSTNLSTIHLDTNCISNIHSESFRNLNKVAELRLDYNYLNKVPHDIFTSNYNLKLIRLDNNNLSVLHNSTLWPLGNVTEVRLNHNKLTLVAKSHFVYSLMVEQIHLQHNRIAFVERGAFAALTRLRHLVLSDNALVAIPGILPSPGSGLLTLHLEHNALSLVDSSLLRSHETIRQLSLKHNRLKFVTRATFPNLTRLARLELNHNEFSIIEDFSFESLRSVRSLELQHNLLQSITNYTFVGLSELEDLDVSSNRLGSVAARAFQPLQRLRSLRLAHNPLRALRRDTFQHRLPLSALHLDSCDIRLIENGTFRGLNNLKYLSLKNNSLSPDDLLAIDVPGLKSLILSHNALGYLPANAFSQLPLLEILKLEHCDIEHILEGTFAHNRNLLKLNLARNVMNALPPTLFAIQSTIADLSISNNFLDYVPYNTLHNLSLIENLNLADNLLPKIELSGFETLTRLKYLILRKNEITSITAMKQVQYSELVVFDVSFNRLQTFPLFLFEMFPNVQNVNVSYNDIVRFDFAMSLSNTGITLVSIDISRNPLEWGWGRAGPGTLAARVSELRATAAGPSASALDESTLRPFARLQHLQLQQNAIRRLSVSPFAELGLLETLDMSHNKIWQLKTSHFRGLANLRALCLSNNNIESLESFTEELAHLKLLDLSRNKIQNILNEDFIHLKELRTLYLGYNNIKYISATAFKNFNNIAQIYLEHNKLQAVPIQLLNSVESVVQEITLKDNLLVCNCQKNNTWVWIQNHPRTISAESIRCAAPEPPRERCLAPLVTQLTVDRHRDSSVAVSWFIRNRTAIKALQIIYYNEDTYSDFKTRYLEADEGSTYINDLERNKNYVVCVITLYDEPEEPLNATHHNGSAQGEVLVSTLLTRSPSSECVSFSTVWRPVLLRGRQGKAFDITVLLNRRMGLMVGCSLGFVVFFVMVTVLLYTKLKRRKRIAKEGDGAGAGMGGEMSDYHSMQSRDEGDGCNAASTDNILMGMTKKRTLSLDIK